MAIEFTPENNPENTPAPATDLEKMQKMLEENLALTKETHAMVHKIKGYITFQKIMSVVYFLLIVVPIVLGLIYLPPLLKSMMGQYETLLGAPQGMFDNLFKTNADQLDLKKLTPQIQDLLDKQNK